MARDSNLEVQAHAQCRGHKLRYQGFTWDRTDGTTVHQQFIGEEPGPARQYSSYPNQAPADYAGLDLDTGHWSENSPLSIFGWLRFDGFAPGEREIWEHKWYDFGESDKEELSEGSDGKKNKPVQHERLAL